MNQLLAEDAEFHRAILDAIPAPVLVVDEDVRIVEVNAAGQALQRFQPDWELHMRGGEMLRCVHAGSTPEGCGHAEACRLCVVRAAVGEAFTGKQVVRRKARMEWIREEKHQEVYLLVTAAPFARAGQSYAVLVLEDISELIELRRILPICASCKRIRDDQQYWDSVEGYFKKQLDVDFSHSICPECRITLYPELAKAAKGQPNGIAG
jgi:nitrogen fixation/metabolism regulation signal transduction histidine kinase